MNTQSKPLISVAPMMDWTDRHCRFFHRVLSPSALLYTEMVTTGAILHGDREWHLAFDAAEHPVALQLGGSDPAALSECAKIGEGYDYDEINLNCGCPSDRVQQGRFGACLMAEPQLVAECVAAMASVVSVPVTVKCRIGIDHSADDLLFTFIEKVRNAGCRTFIVHARQAWLQGLSPKENREVPPLRYDLALSVKERWPELTVIVNGGVQTVADIRAQKADGFDGVMIGREAYQNPYFLTEIEQEIFGGAAISRVEAALEMIPYIERQKRAGVPVKSITRHILGLFNGGRGARAWRRYLSENALHDNPNVIREALSAMSPERIAA